MDVYVVTWANYVRGVRATLEEALDLAEALCAPRPTEKIPEALWIGGDPGLQTRVEHMRMPAPLPEPEEREILEAAFDAGHKYAMDVYWEAKGDDFEAWLRKTRLK